MSKELISSIDIEAPAEKVWELLIDFTAYPTWNPFITRAEGTVEVGGRLTLRMQPVGGSAVTYDPLWLRWSKDIAFAGRAVWECAGSSTPTICSSWSRMVLPGRDLSSKNNSAVCLDRSFSGRWTAAHCRRSTQ
jgi:uncharacterized protein YndB with AHSA1/START domain